MATIRGYIRVDFYGKLSLMIIQEVTVEMNIRSTWGFE